MLATKRAAAAFTCGRVRTPPSSAVPCRDTAELSAMATFEGVINRFPGWIDLALAPVKSGEVVCLGGDTPAHAWSTMKVPVLVALLRARGENGLTPAERDLATRAITASDNQSILELFNELEQVEGGRRGAEAAIQDVLGLCGDRTPFVATALPPLGA